MKSTEIQRAVEKLLFDNRITCSVVPRGETKNGDWVCDKWEVSFNGFTTDYFTGTGHRKPVTNAPTKNWINPRCLAAEAWRARYVQPVRPRPTEVLHCVVLDACALESSFHDWCQDYGYSDDSLSAFDTYRECCDIALRLKKVFSPGTLAELRALLRDY